MGKGLRVYGDCSEFDDRGRGTGKRMSVTQSWLNWFLHTSLAGVLFDKNISIKEKQHEEKRHTYNQLGLLHGEQIRRDERIFELYPSSDELQMTKNVWGHWARGTGLIANDSAVLREGALPQPDSICKRGCVQGWASQRRLSQRSTSRCPCLFDGLAAGCGDTIEVAMRSEVGWIQRDGLADAFESVDVSAGGMGMQGTLSRLLGRGESQLDQEVGT